MKKLLIIALMSLALPASYAQNTKHCSCKSVAAHHKTTKHKTTSNTVAATEQAELPQPVKPAVRTGANPLVPPCYVYRKHNIVVTECPDIMYDNNGNIDYMNEGVYMGYYPMYHYPRTTSDADAAPLPPVAPEHTTINNSKGVAPADGNACNADCSSQ